jgi:hypothetical protein
MDDMSAIPFTDREMQRAWRENRQAASVEQPTNAHRLLLFYAVECGLKALLMRRESVDCTDLCSKITDVQHDINKLLDELRAGQSLKLPNQCQLARISRGQSKAPRRVLPGQVNQMWRYGGKAENEPDDATLEKCLNEIVKWIEKELAA